MSRHDLMPPVLRRLALLLPIVVALCGISVVTEAEGGDKPEKSSGRFPPAAFSGDDRTGDAFLAQRFKEERARPEARAERELSRSRFKRLERKEALELFKSRFPAAFTKRWVPLDSLRDGERVKKYIGRFGAQIVDSSGETSAVESTSPVQAEDSEGDLQRVDLSLKATGDGALATAASPNPVRIDPDSGRTSAFASDQTAPAIFEGGQPGATPPGADAGLSLTVPGLTGEPVETSGRLFYESAATDTNLLVGPTIKGASLLFQLLSEDAPEELPLLVDLPAGAKLELVPQEAVRDGDGKVIDPKGIPGSLLAVNADGDPVGLVSPPVLVDSDGVRLEAEYVIPGGAETIAAGSEARVVVKLAHRGKDARYPLQLDPVTERWQVYNGVKTGGGFYMDPSGVAGWAINHGGGATQSTMPTGINSGGAQGALMVASYAGGYYPHNAYGQWVWGAPGESYIDRADFHYVEHIPTGFPGYPNGTGSCLTEGLFSFDRWADVAGRWWHPAPNESQTAASPWNSTSSAANTAIQANACWYIQNNSKIHSNFSTNRGPTSPTVVFRLGMYGNGARPQGGWAQLYGSELELKDDENPTVTVSRNPSETAWTNGEVTKMSVKGTDPGLGIFALSLSVPKEGTSEVHRILKFANCPRVSRCPNEATFDDIQIGPDDIDPTTETADGRIAEGRNAVQGWVQDPGGRLTPISSDIKVDRSDPQASVGGTLKAAAGTQLAGGQYSVDVTASDGQAGAGATAERSGVRQIAVTVDGEPLGDPADQERPCPAGSCGMTRNVTLNTADIPGGDHLVQVDVLDGAGNSFSESFQVSTPACCIPNASRWASTAFRDRPMFGDVTGDGRDDLVARSTLNPDQYDVARSTGAEFGTTGPFTSWQSFGTHPSIYPLDGVRLADLDGDGREDLVARNSATGRVLWGKSTGTTFEQTRDLAPWNSANSFSVTDLDGDGLLDIAGISASGAVVASYQVAPGTQPSFSVQEQLADYPVSVPAADVQFADVTGDGMSDLVVRASSQVLVGASEQMDPDVDTEPVEDDGLDPADGDPDPYRLEPLSAWAGLASNDRLFLSDVDVSGAADLVTVDGTASGSVPVRWHAASNGSFAPSVQIGTTAGGLETFMGDANGEGHEDLMTYDSSAKGVDVALVRGVQETVEKPASWTPDPDAVYDNSDPTVDEALPELPDGTAAKTVSTAGARNASFELGFADDRVFIDSSKYTAQMPMILKRIRESGATFVRIQTLWGALETSDGMENANAGFFFDLLKQIASPPHSLKIQLTLTGSRVSDCRAAYAPPAGKVLRGCAGTEQGALTSGTNRTAPNGAAFARFAERMALRVRDTPELRAKVRAFGIWNEPNNPTFFGGPQRDAPKNYRKLYNRAYTAIKAVSPGLNVFVGELAADRVSAKIISGGRKVPAARWTAGEFLDRTVKSGCKSGTQTQALKTNGVAWHPYAHRKEPNVGYRKKGWGINNTAGIKTHIDQLNGKVRANGALRAACLEVPGTRKAGKRRGKVPGLYFTEFGYYNTPLKAYAGTPNLAGWPTEAKKANRFRLALSVAAQKARGARYLVAYHATENDPLPLGTEWVEDYGLFSLSEGYVEGNRKYGRAGTIPTDGHPWPTGAPPGVTVNRKAYCAIRGWMNGLRSGSVSGAMSGPLRPANDPAPAEPGCGPL